MDIELYQGDCLEIMPVKIPDNHIDLTVTSPPYDNNDIVFDPFMGSGTTGKMAILNNRNFIGIEKEEAYFNIAKKRIEEAEKSLNNFQEVV